MTYTPETNQLIVSGADMLLNEDRLQPYYHVTIETLFLDIYGIEKYFKRDIQFIVVHLAVPKVGLHDKLYFFDEKATESFIVFEQDALYDDKRDAGKDRPRLSVASVSTFGDLKINWDTSMQEVLDYKEVLKT